MRKPATTDTTINHPMRLFMEDCFREFLNGSWNRELFIQHQEECGRLLDQIIHLQLSAILRFGSDDLKAKTMMAINGTEEALKKVQGRRANKEINTAIPFAKKPSMTSIPK